MNQPEAILLYPKILNWRGYAQDISQTISKTLQKNMNLDTKTTLQKIHIYIESKIKTSQRVIYG